MTTYSVKHRTRYAYTTAVTSQAILHLTPRALASQLVSVSRIDVDPEPSVVRPQLDAHGNLSYYLAVDTAHDSLTIDASSIVAVTPPARPVADITWSDVAALALADRSDDGLLASMCLVDSRYVQRSGELAAFALPSFAPRRPLVDAFEDLALRIHAEFVFDPTFSDVSTPITRVLDERRGVCQDFAHLTIGCLRSMGVPARYVSGYLQTDPPPGQPRLAGADASHAWVSVWVPGFGWYDVDPTNGIGDPARRITVAWGRDYADVAPVQGIVVGPPSEQTLEVAVDVIELATA